MTKTMTRTKKAREERLRKEREADAAERSWRERKARESGRVYLRGLRRIMEESGMSLARLAHSIGLSTNSIYRYARCKNSSTKENAQAIARTLDTTVEELTKP